MTIQTIRLFLTACLYLLFSSTPIFADSKIVIEKGTNVQIVGYVDASDFGDRGYEVLIRGIEDAPNLVLEAEVFPPNPTNPHALKRFISTEAIEGSREYQSSFTNNGQNNSNDKTVLAVSRKVLAELKANGSASFTHSGYSINNKGERRGWASDGTLKVVRTTDFDLSINGAFVTLPALEVRFQGRRRDILNGWDYTDDHVIDFTILDSTYPLVVRQTHNYYKDIRTNKESFAYWTQSIVRVFSVKGLKEQLAKGLGSKDAVSLDGIRFEFGSSDIEKSSEPFVQAIAEVLFKNPNWKVLLSGNTDFIGSESANEDLSRRRASAVENALTEAGVQSSQISTKGNGESLATQNATPEQRAWDRRVDIQRID